MTFFLLCDLQNQADFVKVNLKILNKLKGKSDYYKQRGESFRSISGLTGRGDLGFHDGISHRIIPKSIAKRLGGNIKEPIDFLPLNKIGKNADQKDKANMAVERIALGIEGLPSTKKFANNDYYRMGRGLRKRMPLEDKLANNNATEILEGRNPTQEDVKKLKADVFKRYGNNAKPPRSTPKTKGTKQPQPTIEEKKQRLTQKYGVK